MTDTGSCKRQRTHLPLIFHWWERAFWSSESWAWELSGSKTCDFKASSLWYFLFQHQEDNANLSEQYFSVFKLTSLTPENRARSSRKWLRDQITNSSGFYLFIYKIRQMAALCQSSRYCKVWTETHLPHEWWMTEFCIPHFAYSSSSFPPLLLLLLLQGLST